MAVIMGQKIKILIVGGYGAFGGNLARLLQDQKGLHLLVAGRSLDKAIAFCHSLQGRAQSEPIYFDRNQPALELSLIHI